MESEGKKFEFLTKSKNIGYCVPIENIDLSYNIHRSAMKSKGQHFGILTNS